MVLYLRQNSYRKNRFKLITTIEKASGGQLYVFKTPENKLARKFLLSIVDKYKYLNQYKLPFIINKPRDVGDSRIRFDYIKGRTLLELVNLAVYNNDKERIKEIFDIYFRLLSAIPQSRESLSNNYIEVFGGRAGGTFKQSDCLNIGLLDLNFDNIILDKEQKYHLIDYEWTFKFSIPLKYVLFRGLYYLYAINPTLQRIIPYSDVMSYFRLKKDDESLFLRWEYFFQKFVCRRHLSSLNLGEYRNSYKNMKGTKKVYISDTLRDMQGSIQEKTETITNLSQIIKQQTIEIRKMKSDYLEFQGFKKGRIWKILKLYRRVKKTLLR